MKSRDFAFWLQGFFELGGGDTGLSATQVAVIRQHLGLVFEHDPEIGAPAHPPVAPIASKPLQTFPWPGAAVGDVPQHVPRMIC